MSGEDQKYFCWYIGLPTYQLFPYLQNGANYNNYLINEIFYVKHGDQSITRTTE